MTVTGSPTAEDGDGFEIRRATDADRGSLGELFDDAIAGGAAALDNRWWWQGPEKAAFVCAETATGAVASVLAVRSFAIRWPDGQVREGITWTDWYTARRFTGRGLGRRLTAWVNERWTDTMAIGLSDQLLEWDKEDFQLGCFRVPVSVLRARPEPRRHVGSRAAISSIHLSQNTVLPDVSCVFDRAALDQVAMVRDRTELRDRLVRRPKERYRLTTISRAEPIDGYALWRGLPEGFYAPGSRRLAVLTDVLVADDQIELAGPLIDAVCAEARDAGCVAVMGFTTQTGVEDALVDRAVVSGRGHLAGVARALGGRFATLGERLAVRVRYSHAGRSPFQGRLVTPADSDFDLVLGEGHDAEN